MAKTQEIPMQLQSASVAQLKAALTEKTTELQELQAARMKLQTQVADVEGQIARLLGTTVTTDTGSTTTRVTYERKDEHKDLTEAQKKLRVSQSLNMSVMRGSLTKRQLKVNAGLRSKLSAKFAKTYGLDRRTVHSVIKAFAC